MTFSASMARWRSAWAPSRRVATIWAAKALATAAACFGVLHSAVTVPTSDSPAVSTVTAALSSSTDAEVRSCRLTRPATVSSSASARFVAAARSGTSPLSAAPPATMASAVEVRPNSRSAVARYRSA